MTFKNLQKIIKDNNISEDVNLLYDSGSECSETEMEVTYYHKSENKIVFTQRGNGSERPYYASDK